MRSSTPSPACAAPRIAARAWTLVFVFALGFLPLRAWANGPLVLRWEAPSSCPDHALMVRQVDRYLGGRLDTLTTSVDAFVTVVELGTHAWSAHLETQGSPEKRERTLTGRSCRAVANATALILALMMDPSLHDDAAQAVISAVSEPPMTMSPPEPVQATAPQTAPGLPAYALSLVVGATAGMLPGVSPQAGLRLARTRGRLRFELGGAAFLPTKATLAARPSAGGRVELYLGSLGLCHRWTRAAWQVGPCVALEVGRMHATGFGVDVTDSGTAWWAAARAGVDVGHTVSRNVSLHARAEAVIPVTRPRFLLTGIGVVHQPWRLGPSLTVTADYEF